LIQERIECTRPTNHAGMAIAGPAGSLLASALLLGYRKCVVVVLQIMYERRIQMIREDLSIGRFRGVAVLFAGLLLTFALRVSPLLEAQTAGTATLTVHVTGARNARGKIRAALFQGAGGFPSDASQAVHTQGADIDPQTSSAQIVFTDLPAGVYAVSVFHDENMNQKLDKNFVGVPKEGYGASNNPKKRMGPPSFEETKFQLSGTEQSLEIKLMY
jgi:uncharacterized protein (DUF2141 family)